MENQHNYTRGITAVSMAHWFGDYILYSGSYGGNGRRWSSRNTDVRHKDIIVPKFLSPTEEKLIFLVR